MTKWALQDAKARFSEVVRAARKSPQTITLRGEEAAVVLSSDEYRRLRRLPAKSKSTKTLVEILQSCPYPLEIPPRSKDRGRDIDL